jgi:hypothetical protein
MSDAARVAISNVTFRSLDVQTGLQAFVLTDVQNGKTLTFLEIGAGTDEWAVMRHNSPEPRILSRSQARKLAFESDQTGIGREAVVPLQRAA